MNLRDKGTAERAAVDGELDRLFAEGSTIFSDRLRRRIQDELKSSARPVRALPSSGILFLELCAVFALLISISTAFAGMAGLRNMSVAQMTGMGVILFAGAGFLARSLTWQMIPGSLQRYSAPAILMILAAALLLVFTSLFQWREPEAFLARGLNCVRTGLVSSGIAVVAFGWFASRGAALRLPTLGAILGASGGFAGVTALALGCDHQDTGHLIVWHGAVLAVSVALSAGIAHLRQRSIRAAWPRPVTS